MVMPRSRSRLMESMARSCGISAPHWRRRRSMRVVFPWSTWAMTATFRRQLGSNAFADAAAAAAAGAAEKRRKGEAKERALEEQREEEKAVRAPERRPRSSRPAIPTKKLDCFAPFSEKWAYASRVSELWYNVSRVQEIRSFPIKESLVVPAFWRLGLLWCDWICYAPVFLRNIIITLIEW